MHQPYRLPGQQYDEESGLCYNRNRYYDPLQGRYITQDPIGLNGGWNLYQYPLNPIQYVDPLGLKFEVDGDPTDFNQAIKHLGQDSLMKRSIEDVSKSEQVIKIKYINGNEPSRFSSSDRTIYWNNHAALFCSTAKGSVSQSPALGLGHEIAHAQLYLVSKDDYIHSVNAFDSEFENKEERRVISIFESHAAKTLNECVRNSHAGHFSWADGPTTILVIENVPSK
ncbi:protein rhsD [Shigella flexneri]